MDLLDRVRAVREAGAVERAHVVPHLRPYTVAAHTWGVATLLAIFWPLRPKLLRFALFHDVPERWTGDLPSQVFDLHPDLRAIFRKEDQRITELIGLPDEHCLSPKDWARLRACDRLDLWLWTWEEEALGNRMVLNVRKSLDARPEEFSRIRKFKADFQEVGWKRHSEVLK